MNKLITSDKNKCNNPPQTPSCCQLKNDYKSFVSLFCAQNYEAVYMSLGIVVGHTVLILFLFHLYCKAKHKIQKIRDPPIKDTSNPTYCILTFYQIEACLYSVLFLGLMSLYRISEIVVGDKYFELYYGGFQMKNGGCSKDDSYGFMIFTKKLLLLTCDLFAKILILLQIFEWKVMLFLI